MNKKLIRLTESDLHRIIKGSINKIVNENSYTWNLNDDDTLTDEFMEKNFSNEIATGVKWKGCTDGFKRTGYVVDVNDEYGLGYFHGFVTKISSLNKILDCLGRKLVEK